MPPYLVQITAPNETMMREEGRNVVVLQYYILSMYLFRGTEENYEISIRILVVGVEIENQDFPSTNQESHSLDCNVWSSPHLAPSNMFLHISHYIHRAFCHI
jgi:hypothetical protein